MSTPHVGRHRAASRRRAIVLSRRVGRHRKPTTPSPGHRALTGLCRGLAGIVRSLL